ncbi:MAG: glycosyl hydrolase family 28-related protein, partial [Opitutales bacterium]
MFTNTPLKPLLQPLGISTLIAALFSFSLPCLAKETKPRIAELVYGHNHLVPVITYDVAEAYNADRYGKEDSTAAFQAALDDAEEHGGTVFAPSGRYLINGNLTIPPGVTLRGDWYEPTPENPRVAGTVLMAMAGRGSTDGKPFINVEDGGSLRDFNIVYPQQRTEDIQPYPTCVRLGTNSTVKNMNLVNPYIGVETGSFSTVLNIFGSPLKTGVIMLK